MKKNKLKILLISGKAESGKDALGEFLKQELEKKIANNDEKIIVDRFAKYIKAYAKQLGWDGETKDEKWRSFLEILGTEVIKVILNHKCFHAKRLAEDIQILHECNNHMKGFGANIFIISDCRFKDEIYHLKAMFPNNVKTIRVHRLGHQNKLTEEQRNHISETDLDDFNFDYNIYTKESTNSNKNDSLGQLYDEARRVLGKELNI